MPSAPRQPDPRLTPPLSSRLKLAASVVVLGCSILVAACAGSSNVDSQPIDTTHRPRVSGSATSYQLSITTTDACKGIDCEPGKDDPGTTKRPPRSTSTRNKASSTTKVPRSTTTKTTTNPFEK